ncbi:hypothetical protein WMY93_016781 [Mugilogobius chulae]|uniref:Uncharacterized protein n=1 Tax=Mugilogobius chulae TaxID=88201 RepID=A0AAW0NYJ2_9GOBI
MTTELLWRKTKELLRFSTEQTEVDSWKLKDVCSSVDGLVSSDTKISTGSSTSPAGQKEKRSTDIYRKLAFSDQKGVWTWTLKRRILSPKVAGLKGNLKVNLWHLPKTKRAPDFHVPIGPIAGLPGVTMKRSPPSGFSAKGKIKASPKT